MTGALLAGVLAATSGAMTARACPASAPALPDTIPPGLHVTIEEVRYPVHASSLREAMEAIDAVRLDGDTLGFAHGLTTYRLEPRWILVKVGGHCALRSVSVRLRLDIQLPEWVEYDAAPREDREGWQEYVTALTTHEYAHRDVTLDEAGLLIVALRFLRAGDCPRLQLKAQHTLDEHHARMLARHRELDRDGHGGADPIRR